MSEHFAIRDRATFGFWLYLMSDCVLFASLFAVFVVLQGATYGAASIREFAGISLVASETFILLTSSFSAGIALIAAYRGQRALSLLFFSATLALGGAFLFLELSEFRNLVHEGASFTASAHLSAFFTLVGTHGFHVFCGMLWLLAILLHSAVYGMNEDVLRKMTLFSLFWHFLDIIWIFIFTLVYLFNMV